jgi:hypothetical protein
VLLTVVVVFYSREGGWEVRAKTKLLQHFIDVSYSSHKLTSSGVKLK